MKKNGKCLANEIEIISEKLLNSFKKSLLDNINRAKDKDYALLREKETFNKNYNFLFNFLQEDIKIIIGRSPEQTLIRELFDAYQFGEDIDILLNDIDFYRNIFTKLESQGFLKKIEKGNENNLYEIPEYYFEKVEVIKYCKKHYLKMLKICIINYKINQYMSNLNLDNLLKFKEISSFHASNLSDKFVNGVYDYLIKKDIVSRKTTRTTFYFIITGKENIITGKENKESVSSHIIWKLKSNKNEPNRMFLREFLTLTVGKFQDKTANNCFVDEKGVAIILYKPPAKDKYSTYYFEFASKFRPEVLNSNPNLTKKE